MTCDVCVVREMGEATKRAPEPEPQTKMGTRKK